MSDKHTPGPWRWEFNRKHKRVSLCGGKPQFDLTVMEFARYGMNGAQPVFRQTDDGADLLHKLSERTDWVKPIAGREHHQTWLATINHPDANLIAAAPDLLAALQGMVDEAYYGVKSGLWREKSLAAIAKARGEA